MDTSPTQATLMRLLDAQVGIALGAKGTTNHCPMALTALARMGATSGRLQIFFDRWTGQFALRETHPVVPIPSGQWRTFLGQDAAFSSLSQYFREQIETRDASSVLTSVLTQVPGAPATGAFHAVIRMAYGLEAQHAGEVGAGLAAYVSNPLVIPGPDHAQDVVPSVREGLQRLSARLSGSRRGQGSITGQLRAVAASHDFMATLPRLDLAESGLDEMADAAVDLYCQTRDFTVLHMVTSVHAARLVMDALPPAGKTLFLDSLWPAFAAAYVSVGAPILTAPSAPLNACRDWVALGARAIASDDDHVIKMVYTCHAEHQHRSNPAYLDAAQHVLGPPI